MAVAFGIGVWYGSNIYGRYPKKKVRWTSKRGTGIEDTWNFPLH